MQTKYVIQKCNKFKNHFEIYIFKYIKAARSVHVIIAPMTEKENLTKFVFKNV